MNISFPEAFQSGARLEEKWTPDSSWNKGKAAKEGLKNTFSNIFKGKSATADALATRYSLFTPTRVVLELFADLGRKKPSYSPEEHEIIFTIQFGRGWQRSVNHAKAFSQHAIGWTAIALLVGKLHPVIAIPPFFLGLSAGLIGSLHSQGFLKAPEKEKNKEQIDDLYASINSLNNVIGRLRDIVNGDKLGPFIIAAFLTGAVVVKNLSPKTSTWPFSHALCIGAAAIEGHYLSNEF